MKAAHNRWLVPGLCLFLAIIVWAVFGQTWHHEFVNFDDDQYVYDNPIVTKGVTVAGLHWALTTVHAFNWHPLTWFSHMLDCQFYGLNPGGHHLTSVLLHLATVILLFLVLRQMTGFLWRSAFVAAVFAIHPLRVESVAWIAERKDVLSGFFFMLTIAAYVHYVRRPRSLLRYLMVILMMALALMAKPMAVTIPFVLLLLDHWPLKRFTPAQGHLIPWRLIAEKIPLLCLSCAVCVVTMSAQQEAYVPFHLLTRLGNAVVSYVTYLQQMIYPAGLAAFYPHPEIDLTTGKIIAALVVLLVISAVAIVLRRKQPWIPVGWLWYLGMLVPVIGIVQVGSQAHADRYTYLPQIGVYIAVTWMIAEWCVHWRYQRVVLGGMAAVTLAALIFVARAQTAYWQNSETLWTHTLACTTDNLDAHNGLGNALFRRGKIDEAIGHYRAALEIKPDWALAHYNLANCLLQTGAMDEAIFHYQETLRSDPDNVKAHANLGYALLQQRRVDEAIIHFREALRFQPDEVVVRNKLADTLFQKGDLDESATQFKEVLRFQPDDHDAQNKLALILGQQGKAGEAGLQFQKILQLDPRNADANYNLGVIFLQQGNMREAIGYLQKSLETKPDRAEAHYYLGIALSREGHADDALLQFQQALKFKSNYTDAYYHLAVVLLEKGKVDEAMNYFRKVLQLDPGYAEASYHLGIAFLRKDRPNQAVLQFQLALQSKPAYPEALNSLAWELATSSRLATRNGTKAVALARSAVQLAGENADLLATLAAACAEAGQFDEANANAQKAITLARAAGKQELSTRLTEQLKLYQAHLPFHQEIK